MSFEPLAAAYPALEDAARDDPGWDRRRLALSDSDGDAELHVAGSAVSSSLLDMEVRHLEAAALVPLRWASRRAWDTRSSCPMTACS